MQRRPLSILFTALPLALIGQACSTQTSNSTTTASDQKTKEKTMHLPKLLSVKATCLANPNCYFEGLSMEIRLVITNISDMPIQVVQNVYTQATVFLHNKARTQTYQLPFTSFPPPPMPLPDDYRHDNFITLKPKESTFLSDTVRGFIKNFVKQSGETTVDIWVQMIANQSIIVNGQHMMWTDSDEMNVKSRPAGARWSSPPLYGSDPAQPVPKRGIWRTDAAVVQNEIWLREGQVLPGIYWDRNQQRVYWYWDGPGDGSQE